MKQVIITFVDDNEVPVFIRILEKMKNKEGLTPLDEGFLTKACSEISLIKELD